MTEEKDLKPAAEKAEEPRPKPAVEDLDKSTPEAIAEKPEKPAQKPAEKTPNAIFIGNKPPMSYVLAIITELSSGNITEIMLKARGKAITTAVDVAEITCKRFIKDLRVKAIGIGTEEMPARDGDNRSRNVSTLEIQLVKK